LNDIGATVNPDVIGSYIDISENGGIDGGWFFPVQHSTKLALESSDEGFAVTQLYRWAQKHSLDTCHYLSRDMGASPPRQTEIKFRLSGDVENQLNQYFSACEMFNIPRFPPETLSAITDHPPSDSFLLSVVTSTEGFVKLGLIVLLPSTPFYKSLSKSVQGATLRIQDFQKVLSLSKPISVELLYLCPGFGYEVYEEGFDILFYYLVRGTPSSH
jgi:hypothetical protein